MKRKSRSASSSPSSRDEPDAEGVASSSPSVDPIVMYIFVNSSLKMGVGKIAAQVGHGVQAIVENREFLRAPYREWYSQWVNNHHPVKIVLKATDVQMSAIESEYKCERVFDAGRTQVAAHSFTALAIYPMPKSRTGFAGFSLL